MDRVTEIKEGLKGIGTEAGVYYTNQEIIDRLKELQSALNRGVFEKTHAEHFSEREVLRHFEILAADYGLDTTERFLRLKRNISNLGYTIGSYIKGREGERTAKKGLKLISTDRGVKILYNICLEDDDGSKTEYDAIVIAPYGLFVVEVKNIEGKVCLSSDAQLRRVGEEASLYDIAGRMGMKEALLKVFLGELFPKQYSGMLVFPHKETQVVDEYHRQLYTIGGGVSSDIRLFSKMGVVLSEKQIKRIEEILLESHKEQKTLCKVKCDEIIDDYAHLMAEIEDAAEHGSVIAKEQVRTAVQESNSKVKKATAWGTFFKWLGIAAGGVTATCLIAHSAKQLLKGGA